MATATAQPHVREIGPIGTFGRLGVGLLAIALPIALEGMTWWDALAWIALALVAIAASRPMLVAFERYGHTICDRCAGSLGSCVLAAVLLGASAGAGVATPAQGDVAFWGFLGLSTLLTAARGDAGCELLAIPNAVLRRRDRIGCIIFTPIDAAEARRGTSPTTGSTPTHHGPAPE